MRDTTMWAAPNNQFLWYIKVQSIYARHYDVPPSKREGVYAWYHDFSEWNSLPIDKFYVGVRSLHFLWL